VPRAAVEPDRRLAATGVRAITAPRPVLRSLDHAGPHRVQVHVSTDFEKVAFLLNQDRLEAPLKQMPDHAVATVIGLGVNTIHMPHQTREIGSMRLHHDMVMIAHQAVGKGRCRKALQPLLQHREPGLPVGIVLNNRLAPIAVTW